MKSITGTLCGIQFSCGDRDM